MRRHDPSDIARALRRLGRRYWATFAMILAAIGAAGAHQVALEAREARLHGQSAHVSRQISMMADIMKAAAGAVTDGDPRARYGHETQLGRALGRIRDSRRCPQASRMDPGLRALYRGGAESLCDRADRFFAAADLVARGPRGAQAAFAEMLSLENPIRVGLEAVRARLETRLDAAAEERRLVVHVGLVAVAAMLVAQAAFVFRPGARAAWVADAAQARAFAAETAAAERLRAALADLERSRAEAVAARDAAERADRLKMEFLSALSHEVRTPLNAILGLGDLLGRAPLAPADRERLELMRANAARLSDMLRDTLDLARLASGDFELEPGLVDLRETLESECARHAAPAAEKGLSMTLEADPALPARWIGDGPRIARMAGALIDNALRFTRHGGVTLSLAPRQDGGVVLAVRDTGPGVARDIRAAMFAPFAQGDGSPTRRIGGLGQGLALVKGLATAMGGEITLSDAPGGGAEFRIGLPLMPFEGSGERRSMRGA